MWYVLVSRELRAVHRHVLKKLQERCVGGTSEPTSESELCENVGDIRGGENGCDVAVRHRNGFCGRGSIERRADWLFAR